MINATKSNGLDVKVGDWVSVIGFNGKRYDNGQRRLSAERCEVISLYKDDSYWETLRAVVKNLAGDTADIPLDKCTLADKPLELMTEFEKREHYAKELAFIAGRYAENKRPQGKPITTENQRRAIERLMLSLLDKIKGGIK